MVSDCELPAPIVDAEISLIGLPFMMVHVLRLKKSKAWLACKKKPALAYYLMNLWMAAWYEEPAASIEDDEDALADAAGCTDKQWREMKEILLRGWVKCSDGRLYHPFLCELAEEAWHGRRSEEKKKAKEREKKRAQRIQLSPGQNPPVPEMSLWTGHGTETGRPHGQKNPVPDLSARKGREEKVREERESSDHRSLSSPSEGAREIAEVFEEAIRNLWPNDCTIRPAVSLWATAQTWLDQGIDVTEATNLIRDKLGAALDGGKTDPPRSLQFLKNSAQDLIDRKRGAPQRVNGHSQPKETPEHLAHLRRMSHIRHAGMWIKLKHWPQNGSMGTDPTQPQFCELDRDLLDFVLGKAPQPPDFAPIEQLLDL